MAALGSQSIASSYEQLLHVDRDGGGNGTTLVSVKDGDNGTTFDIQLSSNSTNFQTDFQIGGTAVSSTAAELNLLDGSSDANSTASKAVILDGSGNIALPDGKGIDFSAASGSAAGSTSALLDDYEEGTWTVAATMASGSITLTGSKNQGHYVKIGRQVFISGELGVSAVSSPSGSLYLSLPFTVGDFTDLSERVIGPFSIQNCNFDDTVVALYARSYNGQTTFAIQQTSDNAAWSNLNANTITTSSEFSFSLTFSV